MTAVSQPAGEVTLVFSDIEGSTRLLEELGTDAYRDALAEHRRIVREAYGRYAGYEVDYEGDAFFYAFSSAECAVSAVAEAMAGLEEGPIRIRVGIHTGTPALDPPKYVGLDVHFAARVMSSAHGGQVVCSASTAELIDAGGSEPRALPLLALGEHRLKDIPEPVPLYQLGEGSFPPLKTISNTNLPRPASSFLGREHELQEVLGRLDEGARLLTLTGPGGTGKTRLALEAATALVPAYKAGVFWVGLASLRDPALVSETIAQTLGAKDGLAKHIAERELLLLLDNLEQVIEAAPELASLLEACPNLALLVTSRELLRVRGEVEYSVPPLAAPEAIELFCARAQIEPAPEIAELCARLDLLPLAVELAAARCKALTPAQILERLKGRLDLLQGGRDADPRQATLRATIEWSYDLLTPEEQQLFARLSVFSGGCTLEAAEDVADADLDTLQSLLEKSLLRFTPSEPAPRYWMLETIREYAGERLEERGEAEGVRRRHAEWFAGFVERKLGTLGDGTTGELASTEVAPDRDNVRSALTWSSANDRDDLGLRLGASAMDYWCDSGHLMDAAAWLNAVGPRITAASQELQLEALKAATLAEWWVLGDMEAAGRYAERALTLANEFGTRRDVLWLMQSRAGILQESGDLEGARTLYECSLADYRELGDRIGEANELHHLGELERDAGSHDRAAEYLGAAVSLYRELGEDLRLGLVLHGLGDLALDRDHLEAAAGCYREALEIAREPRGKNYCLAGIASILARRGRLGEAATLWGAVESAEQQLGIRMFPSERERYEKDLGSFRGIPEWTAGRELPLEDAVQHALASLDGLDLTSRDRSRSPEARGGRRGS